MFVYLVCDTGNYFKNCQLHCGLIYFCGITCKTQLSHQHTIYTMYNLTTHRFGLTTYQNLPCCWHILQKLCQLSLFRGFAVGFQMNRKNTCADQYATIVIYLYKQYSSIWILGKTLLASEASKSWLLGLAFTVGVYFINNISNWLTHQSPFSPNHWRAV